MMASFLITWSNHTWIVLSVSILAAMLLTLNGDSGDSFSGEEVAVRPDMVYNTTVGEQFQVNCIFNICKELTADPIYVSINISNSSHINTEWKSLDLSKSISFLDFKNLFMNNLGEYWCRWCLSGNQIINISIQDSKTVNPDPSEDIWLYVYTASGIVAFVVIVIIFSVALMRGCKGKSKKLAPADTQNITIQILEQPFPHTSPQPLPRRSLSVAPSQRSDGRKTLPTRHNELALPRDNEYLYEGLKEDRERDMLEEMDSSVVYVMLNHHPLAGAAAHPWTLKEEKSDYAEIQVKAIRH